MELIRGLIVIPRAGRDKGQPQAVVAVEDGFVLTADGARRPLARPKRRSVKHIARTNALLSEEELRGDRLLRRALARFGSGETSPRIQPK